jgi:uncharacterized protein YndB with AHSA1/START domain
MKEPMIHVANPSLDLLIERVIDVPKEQVWAAWTTPELLMQWFTPVPWKTVACTIDLRPGGGFGTTMRSPEGEEFPGESCYLEVVENRKLVWTSALLPGFRPKESTEGDIAFTAVITMEDCPEGTKYSSLVIHGDVETCKRHEEMGFYQGWGSALDQLVALVKNG